MPGIGYVVAQIYLFVICFVTLSVDETVPCWMIRKNMEGSGCGLI
jgi:hypothetical protein